jgi:hypothetical protein
MIGPGFAVAAFARDAAIILGIAITVLATGILCGVGSFVLCSLLFGGGS